MEDPPTYDRSRVARVGWKMDLYVTMYKMCANGRQEAVDNTYICLHEHAPMGDHKWRLGHGHDWNSGRVADVVDYFAMHCVTLLAGKDVPWLLADVEQMVVMAMRMSGGSDGRTLAAFDRPRAPRTLRSLHGISPVLCGLG